MIVIDGNSLTIEDAMAVMRGYKKVVFSGEAERRVAANRDYLEGKLQSNETMYGINTGFGHLSQVKISPHEIEKLQHNLIMSHSTGYGADFSLEIVRGIMLLRANALAKGYSGVRPIVIERLIEYLNRQIHPCIPCQGSVGASGDLVPLAQMALTLLGQGEVYYKGARVKTIVALEEEGLTPLSLKAKEGLALINGTQAMTSLAVKGVYDGSILLKQADAIAALTLEALRGLDGAFQSMVHAVRPHPGQGKVAKNLLTLLAGSDCSERGLKEKIQDAYSLRCIPQVHGASRDALEHVRWIVEREINSATDNPLIFADEDSIISGGNFHGQPIALAMDYLGMAMAEIGNISERRVERMVNPALSGLPAFLVENSGLNSGYMITQYTAAALVSENKIYACPASTDSIPTSANQEDHVSMGTIAARKLQDIYKNIQGILAIEAICACQGIDLGCGARLGKGTQALYTSIRQYVPTLIEDRVLEPDLRGIAKRLQEGFLLDALKESGCLLE